MPVIQLKPGSNSTNAIYDKMATNQNGERHTPLEIINNRN